MGILLKDLGSFYIGGSQVTISGKPVYKRQFVKGGPVRAVDPNGDFETGQMYVQYFKLNAPTQYYPVLLMHGGGVCGSVWEESFAADKNWLQLFLEHGYDTYVADAMERGRSGFSQYPDIYESEPIFRSKNEAWTNFRIGSEYNSAPVKRIAFEDTQFPVEYFDANLSYELTKYRPINETKGLDFNPDWFTEARDVKVKTGHYTKYRPGTKAHRDFWTEQFRRCRDGYESHGYRITGDNYFFLNFYRLKNITDVKVAGTGRQTDFPQFFSKQYEYFHYIDLCNHTKHDICALKARGVG